MIERNTKTLTLKQITSAGVGSAMANESLIVARHSYFWPSDRIALQVALNQAVDHLKFAADQLGFDLIEKQ